MQLMPTTLTTSVLTEASLRPLPLRYDLTYGMPEPAASGHQYVSSAARSVSGAQKPISLSQPSTVRPSSTLSWTQSHLSSERWPIALVIPYAIEPVDRPMATSRAPVR